MAGTSSVRISSEPYAVDEMQSGASTPSAIGIGEAFLSEAAR